MLDNLRDFITSPLATLRAKVFGAHHERLEFVMDSFYKLEPQQRNVALGILGTSIGGVVTLMAVTYFIRISALHHELNTTVNALSELRERVHERDVIGADFDGLVSRIRSRTRNLSIKPFFEKLATEVGISLRSIDEKTLEMDPQNPLSENVREVHIDIQIANVSIPDLLDFLVRVEKTGKFLRVQNLSIRGQHNKLYFDASFMIRGYKVTGEGTP